MKRIVKMILGAAFLLALLAGLGCAAYADDPSMLVYNVSLYETPGDGEQTLTPIPAQDEIDKLGGTVSVKLVKAENEDITVPRGGGEALSALLGDGRTLEISVPAGYYAANIYMHRDDAAVDAEGKTNIGWVFSAAKDSAALCAAGAKFAGGTDPVVLNSDLLSGEGASATVVLELELRPCPADTPTVTYSVGAFAAPATPIVTGGDSFVQSEHTVLALTDAAVRSAAVDAKHAFIGWELSYPNGSTVSVAAGDVIKPYMNCEVKALWKDIYLITVSASEPNITKTYGETCTLPTASAVISHNAIEDFPDDNYKLDGVSVSFAKDANAKDVTDALANAGEYPATFGAVTLSYRADSSEDWADSHKIPAADCYINYVPAKITVNKFAMKLTAKSNLNAETDAYPEYNGNPQSSWKCEYDKMVTGHKIVNTSISFTGAVLVGDGTTQVDVSKIKIVDAANKDVTANYTVSVGEPAAIRVLPRSAEVKITAKSLTKEYDGTELTAPSEAASVSGLLSGDSVKVNSVKGSALVPGTAGTSTILTYQIMNGDTDVTDCYSNIKLVSGELTVSRRALTLTAVSASKTYDGNILYANKLSGQGFTDGLKVTGLLTGHTLSGAKVTGSGTQAGTYATKVNTSAIKLTDASGNSVAAYYNVRTVDGALKIAKPAATPTPAPTAKPSTGTSTGTGTNTGTGTSTGTRPTTTVPTTLTITAASDSWTYDGEAHSSSEFTATGLRDGDTVKSVTVTAESTITDAGRAKNEISSYVIVDKSGKPVSASKYTVKLISGTLTVDKAQLVLTAASGTVDEEGQSAGLTEVTYSALANTGHKVEAVTKTYLNNAQAEATEVGVYDNKIYSCVIRDAEGNDVTGNYDMRYVNGTVTVRAAKLDSDHGRDSSGDNTAVVVLIVAMSIAGLAVLGISAKLLIDNYRKKH